MSFFVAGNRRFEDLGYQRENSLLQGLGEWLPVGGAQFSQRGESYLLQGGQLEHFLDWDNAEHSAQDCTFPVDRIMEYRVRARGQGSFRLGCDAVRMGGSFHDFTMTTRFTRHTETVYSEPFTLTEEWQEFVWHYQEDNPGTIGHPRVLIEAIGDSVVGLQTASMNYLRKHDFEIIFEPNLALAVPGEKVDFVIHCERANYPLRICIYDGHHAISNGMENRMMTTDAQGEIRMSLTMVSATFEGMRVTASDPDTGVKKSFFITAVTAGFRQRLFAHRLESFPYRRVLFLGDSLTDYDRGRNYVDMVKLLLPEGVSVCNAGIGGDYIGRCLERLSGGDCPFAERYQGILEPRPDLIFLFLGANDTHTESGTHFQEPLTSPELQYRQYKEFLALLRQKSMPGVKFVFISHTPGFYPDQEQAARRRVAAGRSAARFNEERHILAFNRVLAQIAQEEGILLIDAYTPMMALENRRELFISNDGVHMTLKGHQFLAELVAQQLRAL